MIKDRCLSILFDQYSLLQIVSRGNDRQQLMKQKLNSAVCKSSVSFLAIIISSPGSHQIWCQVVITRLVFSDIFTNLIISYSCRFFNGLNLKTILKYRTTSIFRSTTFFVQQHFSPKRVRKIAADAKKNIPLLNEIAAVGNQPRTVIFVLSSLNSFHPNDFFLFLPCVGLFPGRRP